MNYIDDNQYEPHSEEDYRDFADHSFTILGVGCAIALAAVIAVSVVTLGFIIWNELMK